MIKNSMLRWMRSLIPGLKRRDDDLYFASQVDTLRSMASLHHPWYDRNPWARGLAHGQLYIGPGTSPNERHFFRIVLQFDACDFNLWKQKVKQIPKDRFMEAFEIPVRWQWMIEEMQQVEEGGIKYPPAALPGSLRPIDRETFENLHLSF